MNSKKHIAQLNESILQIKEKLCDMESNSGNFPALNRNVKRALASVKMIEFCVSDALLIDELDG